MENLKEDDESVCIIADEAASSGSQGDDTNLLGMEFVSYEWNPLKKAWVKTEDGEESSDPETLDKPLKLKDFEYYLEIDGELCKLMFNKNDDPYEVAVDFIDDHKLDPLYLSAIVDYIEQSRASSKLPFSYNEYFPVQTYYKYLKANVAGLKAKLLEFTDFVSKPHHIPPSKIESLVLLTSYPEQVTQEQLGSLDLVISWDDEYLFPALDLLRLAIRCEGVSVKIGSAALINHLLHILRNTKLCVNRVLIVKIFCNLFDVKDGVELMIKFQAKICGTVKEAVLSTEKTHKSASSLLFNYAVAAFHDLPLDIDLYCLDLIDMMKVIVDSDSLYRIFAAVGTLCFANRPAFMFLQSLNFYDLVLPCQKHATGNANAVLKKLLEAFHP